MFQDVGLGHGSSGAGDRTSRCNSESRVGERALRRDRSKQSRSNGSRSSTENSNLQSS